MPDCFCPEPSERHWWSSSQRFSVPDGDDDHDDHDCDNDNKDNDNDEDPDIYRI